MVGKADIDARIGWLCDEYWWLGAASKDEKVSDEKYAEYEQNLEAELVSLCQELRDALEGGEW